MIGARRKIFLPRPLILKRDELVHVGLTIDDALVSYIDSPQLDRRGRRDITRHRTAFSRRAANGPEAHCRLTRARHRIFLKLQHEKLLYRCYRWTLHHAAAFLVMAIGTTRTRGPGW